MSGSSLIQSRWYFGKPPMMSGMGGSLHLCQNICQLGLGKQLTLDYCITVETSGVEVQGFSVTGSRLIRGVLHCLERFQSKLPAEADTVSCYVPARRQLGEKDEENTGTSRSHVLLFKCDTLKKVLEGTRVSLTPNYAL